MLGVELSDQQPGCHCLARVEAAQRQEHPRRYQEQPRYHRLRERLEAEQQNHCILARRPAEQLPLIPFPLSKSIDFLKGSKRVSRVASYLLACVFMLSDNRQERRSISQIHRSRRLYELKMRLDYSR
jgi:hypothetical protein